LRDCCALQQQGFCCAELLDFCGERELCVRHSEVSEKVASPAWTDKSRCSLLMAAPDWRGNQHATGAVQM
jgi:hypothetical protein